MSITTDLFDRYKRENGLESDNAAGLRLKIRRQTISRWRQDADREGEPEAVKKIALALGLDPLPIVAATTATQQRGVENQKVLREIAKRLGYAAAFVIACIYTNGHCAEIGKVKFDINGAYYTKALLGGNASLIFLAELERNYVNGVSALLPGWPRNKSMRRNRISPAC
jgi:hypothetical protein